VLRGGTWLVGRDTRESGPILEAALIAGLQSQGATVVRCGVVPTPALAYLSVVEQAPAAMITASHNPYTDNGVKIFAAGGSKLSDDLEQRIEAALEAEVASRGAASGAANNDAGATKDDAVGRYVDHIVGLFAPRALQGLRVAVDCANGAMSVAAPAALRALGAEVVVTNADPDGRNINHRCGATHPQALGVAVVEHGAAAGLAFDGDGDRVIAIDEQGGVVDGDR